MHPRGYGPGCAWIIPTTVWTGFPNFASVATISLRERFFSSSSHQTGDTKSKQSRTGNKISSAKHSTMTFEVGHRVAKFTVALKIFAKFNCRLKLNVYEMHLCCKKCCGGWLHFPRNALCCNHNGYDHMNWKNESEGVTGCVKITQGPRTEKGWETLH